MHMAGDEAIAWKQKAVHSKSTALVLSAAEGACRGKAEAVLTAYLLNPFGIAVCVSNSTSIIFWLCVASALYFAAGGRSLLSALCLSLAVLQRVHTFGLILPIILLSVRVGNRVHPISSPVTMYFIYCAVTVAMSLAWLFLSHVSLGWNAQILRGTFLYQLEAAEHKPNFGLYWYFLAEMFEHFRPFFVWVFHLLAVAPIVPAIVKYW